MALANWNKLVEKLRSSGNSASFISNIGEKLTSLLSFDKSAAAPTVGVDIAPDRINLLKISSHVPHEVECFAYADLPKGAMVNDEIKDSHAIGLALRTLIRQEGLQGDALVMAIPRTLAIIKNINVAKKLTDDELESKAWIEANRSFPDLVGDIYLDFTITGPSIQEPDQLDLLLVACRKQHMKPYLEIAQYCGLPAKAIDVNCYALDRSLELMMAGDEQAGNQTVALLNINKSQTSLIVKQNEKLLHAHDQNFDGERLLKSVNDYVEAKKNEPGMDGVPMINQDANYHALLQENLISHLRHTIHFFYSSRANVSINKIILAGDCSHVPDLHNFVEMVIGIKTELANPFEKMTYNSKLNEEEIKTKASALMLAAGLAVTNS